MGEDEMEDPSHFGVRNYVTTMASLSAYCRSWSRCAPALPRSCQARATSGIILIVHSERLQVCAGARCGISRHLSRGASR